MSGIMSRRRCTGASLLRSTSNSNDLADPCAGIAPLDYNRATDSPWSTRATLKESESFRTVRKHVALLPHVEGKLQSETFCLPQRLA